MNDSRAYDSWFISLSLKTRLILIIFNVKGLRDSRAWKLWLYLNNLGHQVKEVWCNCN